MKKIIFLVASLFLLGGLVYGQNGVGENVVNDAIKLYEEGKYNQAMDAFVDILHYGNEEQKNLANEYIDKIGLGSGGKGSETGEEGENSLSLQEPDLSFEPEAKPEADDVTPSTGSQADAPVETQNSTKEPAPVIRKDSFFKKPKKIAVHAAPSKIVPGKVPVTKPAQVSDTFVKGEGIILTEDIGISPIQTKPGKISVTKPEEDSKISKVEEKIPPVEHPVYDKELMKSDIAMAVAKRRNQILTALAGYPPIDVRMLGDLPEFIVINPDGIFSKTVNFKHDTWYMLSYIAGLMYTLREASFTILPPGIFSKDSSLLDIRRAMAINTVLLNEGVSKSRLKIETSASAIESRERFEEADGIIILISYDKTYALKKLADVAQEDKPEITLGVYPNAINPLRGRGVIMEFAVIETQSPIKEWKFELMRTDKQGRLNLIEFAKGATAAFHQIYWNGKRGFTGPFYPSGKYVCSLSASDEAGRKATLARSFTVIISGKVTEEDSSAAKKKVPALKYEIVFENESITIEEDQIGKVESVIEVLVEDEKTKAVVTGFGYLNESDYADYALRRANVIKRMLVDEYGISAERIDTTTAVSKTHAYVLVEITQSK